MATGHDMQLTKQVGEYLVAAEVCRRGFIATTFTGNVPHYDIIALDASGRHRAIQVKAIRGGAWQFDCRTFVDIRLEGEKQIVGQPTQVPYPDLVCVFVRLLGQGADEFYVLTWSDLQKIIIAGYCRNLEGHGGVRPRKHDSFHGAIHPQMLS